ncbi:MAG: hypothetical protein FWB78_02060 [Treponema sp.]|nr:hypothetical protein [Treponema sp.]
MQANSRFGKKIFAQAKNAGERTLLENIEEIISLADTHKLTKAFPEHAKPHLETVASVLKISEIQAAFFSLILEHSDDEPVSIGEIAKAMNCGKVQILKYMDDFEAMEKNVS